VRARRARREAVDGAQQRARLVQQADPVAGQGDAPRRAAQQRDAVLGLEPLDGRAERGLRDAHPARRSREVQLLGDRDEIAQASNVAPWSSPARCPRSGLIMIRGAALARYRKHSGMTMTVSVSVALTRRV
jgi:hypothetical protein